MWNDSTVIPVNNLSNVTPVLIDRDVGGGHDVDPEAATQRQSAMGLETEEARPATTGSLADGATCPVGA